MSRCLESVTPCSGFNNNHDRGSRQETTYVYRERDHKCVKESTKSRGDETDECSCLPRAFCPPDSVVNTRKISRTTGRERKNNQDGRQLFPYNTDESESDTIISDRRVHSLRPSRRRLPVAQGRSKCMAGEVCCKRQSTSNRRKIQPTPSIPKEGSCGKRSACGTAAAKIAYKKGEAKIAEYPWNVSSLRQFDT